MNTKGMPAGCKPAAVPDGTLDAPEITLTDAERQPCEVWTRVMGYHRPTTSFNKGKQAEFAERKYFREGACSRQACGPQMAPLDEEKR